MSKPFKELRGKIILLDIPERKESAIKLSAEAEESLMQENIKKWTKMNVYATGNECEAVKDNDKVYVRTTALRNAEKVDIDGDIKLIVMEHDIYLIW